MAAPALSILQGGGQPSLADSHEPTPKALIVLVAIELGILILIRRRFASAHGG